MRQKQYSPEREIARYICLAQTASDSGKDFDNHYVRGDRGARYYGYGMKTDYILGAIGLIRKSGKSNFRYYVSGETPDQNGCRSVIIYFDFKLDGERLQVSFHTPWSQVENTILERLIGSGRKTRWNKVIGGSMDACKALADHYHL